MDSEWQPISTAPKDCTRLEVKMADGKTYPDAHWAEDNTGEYQPAFKGWFIPNGYNTGYVEIDTPVYWRPLVK